MRSRALQTPPGVPGRAAGRFVACAAVIAVVLVAGTWLIAERPAGAETNPPGVNLSGTGFFFAYVGDGEQLDIVSGPAGTQTVARPGPEADITCTLGTDCTGLTAAEPGVWRWTATASGSPGSAWEINVVNSDTGARIPGRVWVEEYAAWQSGSPNLVDITFWYQSEFGFLYQASYLGYDGIGSLFIADAAGVRLAGTCVSAYRSMNSFGPDEDTDLEAPSTAGECGDAYKLFFEEPDVDLPASALGPDNETMWVRPAIAFPEVTGITFVANDPDDPTDRSGMIEYDVINFTGQLDVLIDVDGNGSFDDPVDRAIPGFSTQGGGSVPFDGLDGLGDPIGAVADLTIRVVVDRAGEIHFNNWDVEWRAGGMEVIRLNGPGAPDDTLYWDDTAFEGQGSRSGTFPPTLDGTAGIPSTGGVHEWDCVTACNTNDGIGGSWGDQRFIDDWTFVPVDITEEITVAGAVPGVSITKSADSAAQAGIQAGQTVTYTFTVENTGEVPLIDVEISDGLAGLSAIECAGGAHPIPSLDPREVETCTATYVVTAGDVAAGAVANKAQVVACTELDGCVEDEDDERVPAPPPTPPEPIFPTATPTPDPTSTPEPTPVVTATPTPRAPPVATAPPAPPTPPVDDGDADDEGALGEQDAPAPADTGHGPASGGDGTMSATAGFLGLVLLAGAGAALFARRSVLRP